MRKNLMTRLIHSELRNKKVSEWTMNSLNKLKRDQKLSKEARPVTVLRYNELKAEALMKARFANAADPSNLSSKGTSARM